MPEDLAPKTDRSESRLPPAPSESGRTTSGGRFSVRGRRGVNRLRFSGRVRGRPLAPGAYVLRAVAVDRARRTSTPEAVRFRIGGEEG